MYRINLTLLKLLLFFIMTADRQTVITERTKTPNNHIIFSAALDVLRRVDKFFSFLLLTMSLLQYCNTKC